MTASRSAANRTIPVLADIPGALTTGAFLIAREAGGRTSGAGVGLFALAAAHVALFGLLAGDELIRRITG